tara:strand:+ start:10465 stop:10593 length:129 start_codon:yes stop_codon:yes gene_type:complete
MQEKIQKEFNNYEYLFIFIRGYLALSLLLLYFAFKSFVFDFF